MTKEIHDINTRALDFVVEIIDYIAEYPDDDYMTMECLCRKLHKYGLVDKKDGFYLVADDTLRKTEPQTCDDCIWNVCNYNKVDWERAEQTELNCSEIPNNCTDLEQFRVGLEYHTDTTHFGKVNGESITTNKVEDEPQTERSE